MTSCLYKHDLVQLVLRRSKDIAEWYYDKFDLGPEDFDLSSVYTYGCDGLGQIADEIIREGIKDGVITEDHVEEYDAYPPARTSLW